MVRRIRHALTTSLAAGLWLGGAFGAAAQEAAVPRTQNTFYAQLGGSGFATVNYERVLSRNASLRVGGGVVPLIGPDFIVMPSLAFGSQRHRFSAGAGLLAVSSAESGDSGVFLTGEMAYRFQTSSGFVLRATLASHEGDGLMVVPGVGVGWSF